MVPYEVTDGLRILGTPIGSQSFCRDFIMRQLENAKVDAKKITEGLDDSQTMLQMFKTCTIHKMTHLYASDVVTEGVANLPNNWHLWRSKMSDEFTNMTNSFLSEVTGRSSIPDHAMLISNMSTNKGGLGL